MARGKAIASLLALTAVQQCAAEASRVATSTHPYCPVFYTEPPTECDPIPDTFLPFSTDNEEFPPPYIEVLEDTFNALAVLQRDYFDPDYGTWPSAIDWTAAVVGTVVSGTLTTLSRSLGSVDLGEFDNWKAKENLISSFYAQVVSAYFGQDVLSIRGQAYDDMLWVVLQWLEAIRFVSVHSALHYPSKVDDNLTEPGGIKLVLDSLPWHGHNWVCSFAHRARIFWNLASHGWDTRLCHGGMIWNPRLTPYKNAITNQLWIAASISMYMDFPGDNFTAPWLAFKGFPERDPSHLAAAIEGYKWLKGINMTSRQGLFVDGYHIDSSKPGNVECDIRDEMVYTYNQGVILTGQRGLWTVSGAVSYLVEGHHLIQSVINATGWSLKRNSPVDIISPGHLPPWRGIGRGGVLEERCDASGTCSQDAHTFKGIFFHHMAAFCEPLGPFDVRRGVTVDKREYHKAKTAHIKACRSYLGWVRHNTLAALNTRESQGRFGMWWGAGLFHNTVASRDNDGIDDSVENTTDYRNHGTPEDHVWGKEGRWFPGAEALGRAGGSPQNLFSSEGEKVLGGTGISHGSGSGRPLAEANSDKKDPNERGRGRTVETQMGGLALLRAYWDMSQG